MFQNYMRRLFWLILGVAVSSIGIAMMLQANVGLEPWSVLQQGMSLRTGMTYGTASAIAGAAAILISGSSLRWYMAFPSSALSLYRMRLHVTSYYSIYE